MVVECLSLELTPQQRTRLRAPFPEEKAKQLQVGQSYSVLGLQYEVGSILWGTGAWVQLPTSEHTLVVAPLCLFRIIDGTPSRLWETRLWEDGSLTLWPPPFYESYFQGDLAAGAQAAVEDFQTVLEQLRTEEAEREQTRRIWPVENS